MSENMRCNVAILSLSLNLGRNEAIPVAAFAIGTLRDETAAALVVPSNLNALANAVPGAFLAEVVETLQESLFNQVDEMFRTQPIHTIGDVMDHLVELFQNTIYVSSVSRDVVVPSNDLQLGLLEQAKEAFTRDVVRSVVARLASVQPAMQPPAPSAARSAMRSWPVEMAVAG